MAIVTGGNSGIGLATANRLLEGGASVLVVDLAADPVIEHSNLRFPNIDVAADEAATRIAEAAIGIGVTLTFSLITPAWSEVDRLKARSSRIGTES